MAFSFPKEKPPLPKNKEPDVRKVLDIRFAERRKALHHACAKTWSNHYNSHKEFYDGRTTFLKMNLTICRLQKVGSQFWRRYFTAYKKDNPDIESLETRTPYPKFYLNTVKIVFVRNPYSRLLSGYVDKFFSANPIYWKKIGSHLIRTIRYKYSGYIPDINCGIDVTFSEFVEYILYLYDENLSIDRHFLPIHFRCDFCNMKYDYIGKMETFLEDIMFVSEILNGFKYNQTRKFLLSERVIGSKEIYRNARHVLGLRRKHIENCGVTLFQALKLTWRKWQIRGFIETKFHFPFPSDIKITWKSFFKLAIAAHTSSDNRKLAEAKMAASREAYNTLSLQTKLRLKEMFLPQFEMFGYDAMPDEVFGVYDKAGSDFSFFETQTIFNS